LYIDYSFQSVLNLKLYSLFITLWLRQGKRLSGTPPFKYNHPHLFGGENLAIIQNFLDLEGKDKILLDL